MNQKKLLNLFAMFSWIMLYDVQISLCSYQEYVVEQKKNPDLTLEDFEKNYADYQQAVRLMASAREFTFTQYLAGVQGDPLYPEYLNAQGHWANGLTFQQFLDRRTTRSAENDLSPAVVLGYVDHKAQNSTGLFGLLHDTEKLIDSGAATLVASVAPWRNIFARRNPEINLVKGYINAGRDVNIQDEQGFSPLFYAVMYNNLWVVKMLLAAPKINVNIQDVTGITPLQQSIRLNSTSITKTLLNAPDINVNIQDVGGHTTLHWAVYHRNVEFVILLLSNPKIDISLKNKAGETALDMVNKRNNTNQTALDLATNNEIRNLILERQERDQAMKNRTRQNLQRQDIDSLNRINTMRARQGQQPLPAGAARNIAEFLNAQKDSQKAQSETKS